MSALLPQTIATSIETFMVAALLVGTFAGAVVAVALRLLAAVSPRSRYLAAVAGIAVSVAVPVAIAVPQALPDAGSSPIQARVSGGPDTEIVHAPEAGAHQQSAGIGLPTRLTELEAGPWLTNVAKTLRTSFDLAVPVWLAGVIVLVIRLGGGLLALRRLRNKTSLAPQHLQLVAARISGDLGLSAPLPVRQGRYVPAPMVFGWWRPSVLLPESTLAELDDEQVEMVLAHEIAHVRRRDHHASVALAVVEAILWFQPVTWWLSRVIRTEREFCCDDAALQRTASEPGRYLRALATLAGGVGHDAAPALAGGALVARFERLRSSQGGGPRVSYFRRGRTAAFAASLVLVAAAAWAQIAPGEDPVRPSTTEVLAIADFERIVWITSLGAFEFSAEDARIGDLEEGGQVIIEEFTRPDQRRGVVISGVTDGGPDLRFTGGLAAAGAMSGEEWLRSVLSDEVVTEILVEGRVKSRLQESQEQLGLDGSTKGRFGELFVSFIRFPVVPDENQAESHFDFMIRSWESSRSPELSSLRRHGLESAQFGAAQMLSVGLIDEAAYEAQMSRLAEMLAVIDEMQQEDPEDGGG